MEKLTKEQVNAIVDWLNNWDQLKGTAIPLRFKEEFTKTTRQKWFEKIKNCDHEIEDISKEGRNRLTGYICKKCGLYHIEVTPCYNEE